MGMNCEEHPVNMGRPYDNKCPFKKKFLLQIPFRLFTRSSNGAKVFTIYRHNSDFIVAHRCIMYTFNAIPFPCGYIVSDLFLPDSGATL